MNKNSNSLLPNRREFVKQSTMAGAAVALTGSRLQGSTNEYGPLCVFSKHLHWLDCDAAAQTAAAIGFQGLDLTVRKAGHVAPENVERDLPKAVAAAQKAGITIATITTEIADAKDPLQQKVLRTAAGLGISHYRMAWLRYDEALNIRDNLQRFRKQLEALAELNEKVGIRGAYQNHAGARLGSPVWDIAELLDAIHSPWLGCQYDIHHATIEGANSWPLGLKRVASHIHTIDIKDFHWAKINGKWRNQSTPLGEGLVDLVGFFSLLKKLGVKKEMPITVFFEYDLGGAENGAKQITVPQEKITAAMRKDLDCLKKVLESI